MERIGEYFAISFCKFGKNFEKVGKSLEKIGKSLGEIPVSASDYMNFSRDIHYFSRMQHPLIWKNIYPCRPDLKLGTLNKLSVEKKNFKIGPFLTELKAFKIYAIAFLAFLDKMI